MPSYPRPAILDQIPRDRHALIEASAGTGKTYLLEHLVVELLLQRGLHIEQLLVLTYTEKAAGELRQRIRTLIERILDTTGEATTPHPWILDGKARQALEQALLNFDHSAIGTIHSFCQSVLTDHAFTAGRLFGQQLVNGRQMFTQAFHAAIRQRLAAEEPYASWLRAWLERSDLDALELLLNDCWTRRGAIRPVLSEIAGELERNQLLTNGARLVATFEQEMKAAKVHGNTRGAILRRFNSVLSQAAPHVTVFDPFRWVQLDLGQDCKDLLESLTKHAVGSAMLLRGEVEHLQSLLVPLRAVVAQLFLPVVVEFLENHKLATGEYDFHDMIAAVHDAVLTARGQPLVQQLRAQYRVALVDEFQDTDDLQWRMFRKVFFESDTGNLLYLVGDPKQAIYAFRGADVHVYLEAREMLLQGRPEALVPLRNNHRSTAAMIRACNQVFDQQAVPPWFEGGIAYDHPVDCGNERLWTIGTDDPAPIWLIDCPAQEKSDVNRLRQQVAAWIAWEIQRLLNDPSALCLRTAHGEPPLRAEDIFILTHTHAEADLVGSYLQARRIPHAFYKQSGLFQTEEAAHIRDLLAAIDDPLDGSRRFQAWLTPFFAVPLARLDGCADLPETHPLVAILLRWKEIADQQDYTGLFTAILEESGIVRRDLVLHAGERQRTNYLHLFEILLEEMTEGPVPLSDLVHRLQTYIDERGAPAGEEGDLQRSESHPDAVQIMTMHASKGLEAAVVFVFGGFNQSRAQKEGIKIYHEGSQRIILLGDDPGGRARADREQTDEQKRLLYVALTRARARLYVPFLAEWPSKWDGPTGLLNARLKQLAEAGAEGFHRLPLTAVDVPRRLEGDMPAISRDWRPHLRLPSPDEETRQAQRFQQLRRKHAGLGVTSYSRMKRGRAGYVSPLDLGDFTGEHSIFAPTWLPEGSLPGGIATGNFLHETLEQVDLSALAIQPPLDEWRERPDVQELFRRKAYRHGLDLKYLPEAQRIIYYALTIPISLGSAVMSGLATTTASWREVEFLYPFPENVHPGLTERFEEGRLSIERGYIMGYVDFVFVHDDRYYFADWKSDVLPDYAPASLAEQVQRNYSVQIKLYSLAMVKILGIHDEATYNARFGGLLYCFLRAMALPGGPGHGTHFRRPTWSEVLRYDAWLRTGADLAEEPE